MKYLTCTKCKKIAKPRPAVFDELTGRLLHTAEVGTSVKMRCPDCKDMCRDCCPTGHRTRYTIDA